MKYIITNRNYLNNTIEISFQNGKVFYYKPVKSIRNLTDSELQKYLKGIFI